jgi:hypothetical protein
MAEGHARDQPLAAPAAAVGRRHIGLGPGFIDENEAFGIDPALIPAPTFAAARNVRPIQLAGVQAFFECDAFLLEEMPHRIEANFDAALGQFDDQRAQRDVGLGGDAREQPVAFIRKGKRAFAAHRLGGRAAAGTEPLRPLHDTGWADSEDVGNGATGRAILDGRDNAFSEIEGVCSRHVGWPPLQPTASIRSPLIWESPAIQSKTNTL